MIQFEVFSSVQRSTNFARLVIVCWDVESGIHAYACLECIPCIHERCLHFEHLWDTVGGMAPKPTAADCCSATGLEHDLDGYTFVQFSVQ